MNVVRFTNFSNEDFVGYWDKAPFKILASETIMLQEYLATHFAKHLIDRELNKVDEPTNNQVKRDEMLKLCLGGIESVVESEEQAETEILNQKPEEDLKSLSRKELNKIAEEEGISKPGDLPSKSAVVEAIQDTRGEENKDIPPAPENTNEEDEFEGDK